MLWSAFAFSGDSAAGARHLDWFPDSAFKRLSLAW
jgi:hypothetical protein